MREYATEGLVLQREPAGEIDWRVTLFTRDFGKLTAKVKSGRRITSKLAPHLEPLNVVMLRLIEKGGFQVADALRMSRLPQEHFSLLRFLADTTMEGGPDHALWTLIERHEVSPRRILFALGLDPRSASCSRCGVPEAAWLVFSDASYRCTKCERMLPASERRINLS